LVMIAGGIVDDLGIDDVVMLLFLTENSHSGAWRVPRRLATWFWSWSRSSRAQGVARARPRQCRRTPACTSTGLAAAETRFGPGTGTAACSAPTARSDVLPNSRRKRPMATHTAVEDSEVDPSQCWCCGAIDDPTRMVHLGNHPEVALCLSCARWASKEAAEIEDQGKAGPLVLARDRLRAARRSVVQRGWHHKRWFGGPLRWVGRRLP
jgi:hypothetical protein